MTAALEAQGLNKQQKSKGKIKAKKGDANMEKNNISYNTIKKNKKLSQFFDSDKELEKED